MNYFIDTLFLVIVISKLSISLSRIHFPVLLPFFITFALFCSSELVIVLLKKTNNNKTQHIPKHI